MAFCKEAPRSFGRRVADRHGRVARATLSRAGAQGLTQRRFDCAAQLVGFGLDSGVPCGTQDLVLMSFQGRCPWLISGVPDGTFRVLGSTGSLSQRGLSNVSL